jgi:N-acetylneuraminic acid mutarotase
VTPIAVGRTVAFAAILALARVTARGECAAGRWMSLAPLSEPRQELAAAPLGGKVYAVAGLAGRANANEIYDPATDSWSFGADLPVGTDHAWAVGFDGRVWVGGGTSNRVFSYHPAAKAWTEVARSSFFHGGTPAAAVIGGRIFVAGGTGGGMVGNEVEVYDPAGDVWSTLAPMGCARNHTAGGVIGGKLYVAGGRPGNQSCLEVYDPATNVWARKTSMPTGRSGIAGAVVNDCLYVFGGEGNGADPNGIFHQVEAYDPATDSWTQLPPMQTGRHGIYAAVIGNVIYLPGGATRLGFGVTGTHDAYVIEPSALIPRQPVILSSPRRRPPT